MTAQHRSARSEGFTLIELLVVIAIIVTMAALLIGGLGGAGKSANLQAAQNMISNVLTVARAKAISSQRRTRIIFQAAAGTGQPSERFLHFFALQQLKTAESDWRQQSDWATVKSYVLPEGVYVLPVDLDQFPALVATNGNTDETNWQYSDGSQKMGSRLFAGDSVSIDLKDGHPIASYQGVMFTERGTISQLIGRGYFGVNPFDILVATGRLQSPDIAANGGSPIVLSNANEVRAVQVSTYGVPMLVNNREDF